MDWNAYRKVESNSMHGESLYRILAQNLPDTAVIIFDRDMRFMLAEGKILSEAGYSKETLVGKTAFEILPRESLDVVLPAYRAALEGHESEFDHGWQGKQYHTRIIPIKNDKGEIEGGMIVAQDVTRQKQTEMALENNEARYRAIVESQTEAVCRYKTDGILTFVNDAFCSMFHKTREALLGTNLLTLIPPETKAHIEWIMQDPHTSVFEQEIVNAKGESLWLEWIDQPIRDSLSKVIEFQSVGRDRTSLKRFERALQDSEERFRELVNNLHNHVFWLMSPDGNQLHYVSPSVEVIWGIPAQQLYQDFSSFFETIHPDDRDQVMQIRKQALTSGSPGTEDSPGTEYRIIRPDGTIRWVISRIFAIMDEHQHVIRIAGVMEDITERKEAEIALREGEARFREFADNIGSIFWMLSPDAKNLLYVSPAYEIIWGRPCEEMYQNPLAFADAIHPDDRENVLHNRTEKLLKGLYNIEYRIIRPDGEIRWVTSRGYLIRREGKIQRIVGITEDITARKELEKQTFDMTLEREYGRVLANFVRDTSHDLRTPLSILTTGLYLLRKTDEPQKRIERIDALEEQVKHLHKVINDLQTMANLDISVDLTKAAVNINQLVQSVVDLYVTRIVEHGHRIEWHPGERISLVQADAGELRHALSNLIDNAILFTPSGDGIITLSTTETPEHTIISIRDNGIGIDEQHMDDIFERFYKVDAARPSGKSGPGLGLTMAKKIIEMHDGYIEVESIPGQGSTFKIYLPRHIRYLS